MMQVAWWFVPAALMVDMLAGDPQWLPHPVRIMGRLIATLDVWLRDKRLRPGWLVVRGFLLWAIVVTAVMVVAGAMISVSYGISVILGTALTLWLASTTIAAKGLAGAAKRIGDALRSGDISEARTRTAEIVGRDTAGLTEPELVRAAVESVAENTVDAVISPMFHAAIGGAPLAMVYRAVNTMDSMLGYKDEDYLYFGRAAARLDDLFNYLPARLTGLFMCVAASLCGYNAVRGFGAWVRDAASHPSPNAGIPEAVMAGSLGVQLGGLNYYDGIPRERARMGDQLRQFSVDDINAACRMMLLTSTIASFVFAGLTYAISRVWL